MSQFPKAIKVPAYEIDGILHRRVTAQDGIANPNAIRASVPISKGPDKGGEKILWFVRIAIAESGEGDILDG